MLTAETIWADFHRELSGFLTRRVQLATEEATPATAVTGKSMTRARWGWPSSGKYAT